MGVLVPFLLVFLAGAAFLNAAANAWLWALSRARSTPHVSMALFSSLVGALSILRGVQLYTDDVPLALLCGDLYSFLHVLCVIPWVAWVRALDGRPLLSLRFTAWALVLVVLAVLLGFTELIFTSEPLLRHDVGGAPFWGHQLGPAAALMGLVPPLATGAMLFVGHRYRTDDRVARALVLASTWGATLISTLMVLRLTGAPSIPAASEFMFPMMILPAILFLLRRQVLLREGLEASIAARTADLDAANHSLLSRNAELATTLEDLKAATAAQAKMLANVSHELRTPLHAVIASTQLVVEGDLADEPRELVGIAYRAGQELSALIDDLLDAARLSAPEVEIEDANVDLAATVDTLLGELATLADAKGLVLVADMPERLGARGDPRRVRQILRNLVANAIRYSDHGQITVSAEASEGTVSVAVDDTGRGIPEAELEAIFEPFRQVRRPGDVSQGTGLGLSIARDLATRMGGTLTATSKLGEGSRFVLRLPACELPAEDAEAASRPSSTLFKGRVLVVDDNPLNRLLARRLLEARGLEVELAEAGAEAVAKAPMGFDLILMDCYMPGVDGFEATQRIRALDGAVARTPIVALTASALASDIERALTATMDAHLAKPIDVTAMHEVLARFCEEAADAP